MYRGGEYTEGKQGTIINYHTNTYWVWSKSKYIHEFCDSIPAPKCNYYLGNTFTQTNTYFMSQNNQHETHTTQLQYYE